jgi:hypothetical protein
MYLPVMIMQKIIVEWFGGRFGIPLFDNFFNTPFTTGTWHHTPSSRYESGTILRGDVVKPVAQPSETVVTKRKTANIDLITPGL